MLLQATCALDFESTAAVPMVLMLRPRSGEAQWVRRDTCEVDPALPVVEYVDLFGNSCQRLTASPGSTSIRTQCEVEVADEVDSSPGLPPVVIESVPNDVLHFLLPSRYCESDQLIERAQQIAGSAKPGYDQAELVRSWVNQNVTYVPGSSDPGTSALNTLDSLQGVCRDQAHLGIALCRALNFPARMVVGYLHGLEPMDLHAWFECYIGDRWFTFDAKEPTTRPGRIVIGYGRDAADVALVTQFGFAELKRMEIDVELIDPSNDQVGTGSISEAVE